MITKEPFKVLSKREELKLSNEQLKLYYKELREYVLNRPLTNTTKGATVFGPKLKGITNKIAIAVTKMFTNKDVEWLCDGQEYIPSGSVIFAHTHQGILDNFLWLPMVKQHCVILHSADANKLLLACQLNTGLVLVKKGDKENNHNSKLDMIKLLLEGTSITYFPEGAWNLSPNKLHLPLSYGFLDIASKTNVPVVPVAHEFTYNTSRDKEVITKIHTRFGKPIYVTEVDDLKKKLEEYEESISTMRYELIEEKGLFKRADITNRDYINFLKGNYRNLKLGKINLERERINIFGGQDDFYLFHNINDVPFDEEGNLLETEEKRRLERIMKEHRI